MRIPTISGAFKTLIIAVVIVLAPHAFGADVHKDADIGLVTAAQQGDLTKLNYCLSHGADINAKDADGNTALFAALESGKADCAHALIEHGAAVNVRDQRKLSYNCSALSEAIENISVPHHAYKNLIAALLDKGADVNAKDDYGTPLLHAASAACFTQANDVFRLLIQHGADISVKNKLGQTVLMEVLGHVGTKAETEMDMVQALTEKGADLLEMNQYGQTALTLAACGAAPKIVRMLVDNGDDVNRIDAEGMTPLLHSCECEPSDSVVRALLECGANVNVKDRHSQSPLAMSCERGKTEIVRMLLAKNADVDIRGDHQETALMQAANQLRLDVVHLLVEHGAAVNARDDAGYSPLMWAVQDRRYAEPIGDSLGSNHKYYDSTIPVVEYLLQRGADINASGKDGCTVRAVAWKTNASIADWLGDRGAHMYTQVPI